MMPEIKKEIKYALRSGKFLVLMIAFLFFAISTPIMTKVVLPEILKSQFPGADEQAFLGMLDMTQLGCVRSYMGDVFEIGSIIIAFTLCGLIAQELRDNTLVLPLCAGKRLGAIVIAKVLVFGIALMLAPTLALLVDYAYAGLLFSFEIGIAPILRGGLLQGIYMVFLLSCLMMWGALAKRPIPAGFLTLATAFGLHFVGGLFNIHEYLPGGLLLEAQKLAAAPAASLARTLAITCTIVLVFLGAALARLHSIEWNQR